MQWRPMTTSLTYEIQLRTHHMSGQSNQANRQPHRNCVIVTACSGCRQTLPKPPSLVGISKTHKPPALATVCRLYSFVEDKRGVLKHDMKRHVMTCDAKNRCRRGATPTAIRLPRKPSDMAQAIRHEGVACEASPPSPNHKEVAAAAPSLRARRGGKD